MEIIYNCGIPFLTNSFRNFFYRQVLEEMEMLSAFTAVLHVPNISTSKELIAVLEETDAFSSKQIEEISRKTGNRRLFIGIKKLLALIDMAKQTSQEYRVNKFICKLEEEGAIELA